MDSEWTQQYMRFDAFLEEYILKECLVKAYLAQHRLFDQIPELKKDIFIPDYCALGQELQLSDVQLNAWLGPSGTISPLHFDPYHNLLCQVVGCKYIRLYLPNTSDCLYPNDGMMFNTSKVIVEDMDQKRYPKFIKCNEYFETILQPGQMLYIPPNVWHYIRALDVSFSVRKKRKKVPGERI